MGYKNLVVDVAGSTAVVTINRPDKLNSLDADTLESLDRAMADLAADKRCMTVIITGAGDRSFSAGADINYISSLKDGNDAASFVDRVHAVFDRIERMEKPVIAAVNGYCLGGGCELAMACDIRIAANGAVFGQPEVKLGITPGGGGTYRLPALVGIAKAKELIFLGDHISADEALRIGLVNRVVEPGSLMKEARSIAERINQNSPIAVKNAKSAINANAKGNGSVERSAFVSSFKAPDSKRRISSFIKRSRTGSRQ